MKEVPLTPDDPGYVAPKEETESTDEDKADADESSEKAEKKESDDDDEVIVEDAVKEEPKPKEIVPQMKNVTYNEWDHLNNQPPLWMRDPKNVTNAEYNEFYRATFKGEGRFTLLGTFS